LTVAEVGNSRPSSAAGRSIRCRSSFPGPVGNRSATTWIA